MKWVPLWNDVLQSRKIQSLSGEAFKSWINLLCLASKRDEDGRLPGVEDIAFALRIDEEKAKESLEMLVKHGLIDRIRGGFAIHDWDDWQLKSYSSTDRVKRFRERHRRPDGNEEETACNGDETPRNVSGNMSETSLSSHETLHETPLKRFSNVSETGCNDLRIEREEKRKKKKEKNPPVAPPEGGDVSGTSPKHSEKSFVLPDWIPVEDWDAFVEMRKKQRNALTGKAMEFAVKKLSKFRESGHDPTTILQEAVLRGWRGLFVPDDQPIRPVSGRPEKPQEYYDHEKHMKALLEKPIR